MKTAKQIGTTTSYIQYDIIAYSIATGLFLYHENSIIFDVNQRQTIFTLMLTLEIPHY